MYFKSEISLGYICLFFCSVGFFAFLDVFSPTRSIERTPSGQRKRLLHLNQTVSLRAKGPSGIVSDSVVK